MSALILAGGGLQAAAAIQEGRIAKAQGSFENKIALRNQESLNRQAEAEEAASRLEEERIAKRQKIFQGRQLARIGKGGAGLIDATLAALVDTASQFSIERNLALRRGVFRAGALRERGVLLAARGRWAKTLGTQAQRLSFVKAGAAIGTSVATASLLSQAGTSDIALGQKHGILDAGGFTRAGRATLTRF